MQLIRIKVMPPSGVHPQYYVLSICKLLFCFLHCLEHAHKNFTHQGTCAVVM